MALQPLKSELVDPVRFRQIMLAYGASFMKDRSNDLRHIYYSRRLDRWFGVSSEKGAVRVNHYSSCPCAATK